MSNSCPPRVCTFEIGPQGRTPNRWRMLLPLLLARTSIAFQFQTTASAAPILINSFDIDYTMLGTLIGMYMLPGVIVALPGGIFAQHLGSKRVVLAGLALMTSGGILASSGPFEAVFVGRIVSGIGATLLNVIMTKMVADWFVGKDEISAMSIFVASWPLGLAIGILAFPPLSFRMGWSAVSLAGALGSLVSMVSVWLLYRDPPQPVSKTRPGMYISLSYREWVLVSLAGVIWGSFNVSYVLLVSFLPDMFSSYGYSATRANHVVSALGWGLIFFLPACGLFFIRFNPPKSTHFVALICLATMIALLPFQSPSLLGILLIVIGFAAPAGLLLTLPTSVLHPNNRATGMGVFYTWFYGMMAVIPAAAGTARAATQNPSAPIILSSLMIAGSIGVLLWFQVVSQLKPRSAD